MMDRFINNSDYPQDLFLMGDDAAELADPSTALVVVDVNRPSYTEEPQLLNLVKTIVVTRPSPPVQRDHQQRYLILCGALRLLSL